MDILDYECENIKLRYAFDDIKSYNPYVDLAQFMGSEFFEQMFLEYVENFREQYLNVLKEELGHQYDYQLDTYFNKIVKKRNDEEVARILQEHSSSVFDADRNNNEEHIIELKKRIRVVKDIVLAVEPTDMKRLQKIDDEMGKVIDDVSLVLKVSENIGISGIMVEDLFTVLNPEDASTLDEYTEEIVKFKEKIAEICDYYRRNYSVSMATKHIEELTYSVDSFLDEMNKMNDVSSIDNQMLELLLADGYSDWQRIVVHGYVTKKDDVPLFEYDKWVLEFRKKIDEFKADLQKRHSNNTIGQVLDMVDTKTGKLIDKVADSVGYSKEYKDRLGQIMDSYVPEDLYDSKKLGIFDSALYSSEQDRNLAYYKYYPLLFNTGVYLSELEKDAAFRGDYAVSLEEAQAFEMRMYEQYNRVFKGKIRELNKSIRQTYSLERATRMINSINKKADALIRGKASELGKLAPKNPWLARKYLWADTKNFMSENGLMFRQVINPLMRNVVRVAMNNKLIIEERSKLDPTKQYIFVPTHYFTEDAIGMFASLDRQAYMLMGTTDQIENNPLMLAAVTLGFFYVDRMDYANRSECVEKQNRIIDFGANFINYVSGSWENSENELQPLSFSGPYRTSVQKGVEIVPVGLYLVREDKKIYVRYGDPMDLRNLSEKEANDVIRNTLATMHFKQMHKHSVPIDTIEIEGYGKTHNLPYDQHIYYMEQVANEYWNQPWTKPFAVEEIGIRPKKVVDEVDVYRFIDDLSSDKLVELSGILSEPLLRRDEKDNRYNVVKYIDDNYDRLRNAKTKRKVKTES